jgi:hypothetical protein
VGRPTVYPPCLSPLHRPLNCPRQQTQPPDPPSQHSPCFAASREEQQGEARTRRREGPANGFQRGPYHDYDLQRSQVDFGFAMQGGTSSTLGCPLAERHAASFVRPGTKRWQSVRTVDTTTKSFSAFCVRLEEREILEKECRRGRLTLPRSLWSVSLFL